LITKRKDIKNCDFLDEISIGKPELLRVLEGKYYK